MRGRTTRFQGTRTKCRRITSTRTLTTPQQQPESYRPPVLPSGKLQGAASVPTHRRTRTGGRLPQPTWRIRDLTSFSRSVTLPWGGSPEQERRKGPSWSTRGHRKRPTPISQKQTVPGQPDKREKRGVLSWACIQGCWRLPGNGQLWKWEGPCLGSGPSVSHYQRPRGRYRQRDPNPVLGEGPKLRVVEAPEDAHPHWWVSP